jgi:hypothetical protein
MSPETGTPSETGPEPTAADTMSPTRWILIVLVVVAIILFISWARREPGFDDRVPDPEDAVAAFVVTLDRGGV